MKFKIGDKVRVIGTIGADNEKNIFTGDVSKIFGMSRGYYFLEKNPGRHMVESQLELLGPRTIEDVQEDDIITDGTYFRRVLGRCGKVVFLSINWKKGEKEKTEYSHTVSIQFIKISGYSIVQDTQEEVIEVNGKKYKADEVKERLSELKALE